MEAIVSSIEINNVAKLAGVTDFTQSMSKA